MSLGRVACAVISVSWWCSVAAAQPAATVLVEPPTATAMELNNDGDAQPIHIPMVVKDGVAALTATVTEVAVNGHPRPSLIPNFTPEPIVGSHFEIDRGSGSMTARATSARIPDFWLTRFASANGSTRLVS